MKYKLTNEKINLCEKILYRIQRLSDGELGGFIESEGNLSQEGNAKVSKTPLTISGLQFPLTKTETHIFIGCYGKTIEEWKQISKKPDKINKLGSGALEFFRENEKLLTSLLEKENEKV
jgi:hypothetical protein